MHALAAYARAVSENTRRQRMHAALRQTRALSVCTTAYTRDVTLHAPLRRIFRATVVKFGDGRFRSAAGHYLLDTVGTSHNEQDIVVMYQRVAPR